MENEQEKKKYSAPCSSIITVERVGRSLVGRDVNSEREKGTTIMLYGRKNWDQFERLRRGSKMS